MWWSVVSCGWPNSGKYSTSRGRFDAEANFYASCHRSRFLDGNRTMKAAEFLLGKCKQQKTCASIKQWSEHGKNHQCFFHKKERKINIPHFYYITTLGNGFSPAVSFFYARTISGLCRIRTKRGLASTTWPFFDTLALLRRPWNLNFLLVFVKCGHIMVVEVFVDPFLSYAFSPCW